MKRSKIYDDSVMILHLKEEAWLIGKMVKLDMVALSDNEHDEELAVFAKAYHELLEEKWYLSETTYKQVMEVFKVCGITCPHKSMTDYTQSGRDYGYTGPGNGEGFDLRTKGKFDPTRRDKRNRKRLEAFNKAVSEADSFLALLENSEMGKMIQTMKDTYAERKARKNRLQVVRDTREAL